MLLTLAFLALTLFFAKKAINAKEETGTPNWFAVVAAVAALVVAIFAATNN